MADDNNESGPSEQEMAMRKAIMAIMMDTTLSDADKAQKRQQLMCGGWKTSKEEEKPAKDEQAKQAKGSKGGKTDLLEDTLKCVICVGLCERPVTGPCQHNFCLACFKRWLAQGKKTCPTCRTPFPNKFIENPRINTLLTYAIRCAKQGNKNDAAKVYNRIADESRPAEAFTTDRAVRNGRANAASGRIMVNVPGDHFGPILPEHDPTNGKGVQVGDWWKDRLDCRQWGAHFPHVAGIAGQSNRGAQSVVLSGGYEDDHDEGEWFMYTGSGGRDLSGNKRTNKTQSFDQEFESMNKALKISCLRGLPVRVVRSFKEKRSSYAPPTETPVRYDGLYRILRCWRKKGAQGFLMCRYLFVRCDNSPAPWTSDETGDAVRMEVPQLAAKEIKEAKGTVFEMADTPYWDYDEAKGAWGWAREAPPSQKAPGGGDTVKKLRKKASGHERLLKDFACGLCKSVLDCPLSMPCGHNFCKGCLDKRYAEAEAAKGGGSKALAEAQPARSLRVRKVPKPCPTCKTDIADYMAHAAVNTEMAELIRRLQQAAEDARKEAEQEADGLKDEAADDADAEGGEAADPDADADGADEEEADEDGGSDDAEQEQDEEVAAGKTKGKQPAKKRQRTAAGGSKAAAAAAAAAEAPDAAAVDEPTAAAAAAAAADEKQEQQPAAAAAAAPAAAAASRYGAELSQLCESFPEFDRELIGGMLEDQGGDVEEVHAYLKRMKNQLTHAKRTSNKAAAGQGAPAGKAKTAKGRGRGSSKGKQQQAATAAAGEAEEAEPAAAEDAAADGAAAAKTQDGAAKQAAAAAEDDAAEAVQEDATRDTPPPLDAARKVPAAAAGKAAASKAAAGKPTASKAAAGKAAGEAAAEGEGEAAAAEAAVGKKRRQGAAASSGKASKRAK